MSRQSPTLTIDPDHFDKPAADVAPETPDLSRPTISDFPDMRGGRWIEEWPIEDEAFWEQHAKPVARRNLIFSVLAEHVGFSVWMVWSVVVVSLPAAGFDFTVDQLLWLVSVPALVGALLRVPYTFAVPIFGGRNWTVISALLLLIPAIGLTVAVSNPDTPFGAFLLVACAAGFGGGNFASSMANISFFYPKKNQGLALGVNAAGGNLGASSVQLLIPLVIGAGSAAALARAGVMWVPLIVISAITAFLFMNNLRPAKTDVRVWLNSARRGHTWAISMLYVGTFGSFIGYSAAFPLLIKTEFPDVTVVHYAFLGPLIGSLARPIGGWLADRWGGARITMLGFIAMGIFSLSALVSLQLRSWPLFLASFLVLFLGSGAANGSVFRMIPSIFDAAYSSRIGLTRCRAEAAGAIGISSAVGALGGFLLPRILAGSINNTGGPAMGFAVFAAIYALCMAVTWFLYINPGSRSTALSHHMV